MRKRPIVKGPAARPGKAKKVVPAKEAAPPDMGKITEVPTPPAPPRPRMMCPSCGAPFRLAKEIPLKLGEEVAVRGAVYGCGSTTLTFETGSMRSVRSVECATRRMVQLEKELHGLRNDFWCDDPREAKLLGSILSTWAAFEAQTMVPKA